MIWIFSSSNFKLFLMSLQIKLFVTAFKRSKHTSESARTMFDLALWWSFISYLFFLNPNSPLRAVPATQSQLSVRYSPSEMSQFLHQILRASPCISKSPRSVVILVSGFFIYSKLNCWGKKKSEDHLATKACGYFLWLFKKDKWYRFFFLISVHTQN